VLLTLLTTALHSYVPYEIDRSQENKIYELSSKIILLGCINFTLILSTSSSVISWSGITLRDKFQLPEDLATLGAFGFVFSETAIRFYGDRLTKRFGKIPLLIGTGLLTCLSLLLVYLTHHPIWALLSFTGVGLASGTIQPIVFSLTAEQKGNVSHNMSFIMLFQSVAFLSGPMITGSIAQHIGLIEIYLFCSFTSILILLFAILFRNEQKKLDSELIS
jgi:MFS family permease